jgi:alkylhydroperoxidase/carboxymuconolactone decarboxylase family protein YurZ
MAARRKSKTPYTDRQIRAGDWNPLWDTMREWDPEFIEAYLTFRSVPHRKGPLPQKVKEFILIAINAATTHLYAPGVRRHMQNALKLGATREELLEVIQLTTIMGIHAINVAVPILSEEIAKQRPQAPARKPKPAAKRKGGSR